MRLALSCTILAALLFPLSGCHSRTSTPSIQEPHDQPLPSSQRAPEDEPLDPSTASTASDEPTPAAPRPSPSDGRPVLVCFGDSLTAGLGTDPGQSYPDYLQQDLNRLGYKYQVENLGISGNTTKDGVARLPDVLALHPALVVVEFGGNDGLRGLPLGDTRKNLEDIVSTLQKAGIKIALAGITLPPDYGEDYVSKFNANYTDIAREFHIPMLPFLLKNVYGVPGMMQRDQTHATAQGNAIVANNVLALIRPMLRK